jgi:glycerophosphoryl diester phosphodiesterase
MTAADMPPVAPVYGHRCLPGDGKENTLEALDRVAKRMQKPACEIDAWQLADGRWVVVHDPTWTRTIDPATLPAGTPAAVNQTTFDQVRQMRTVDGRTVPTLKRFLNRAKDEGVQLLVEVKNMTPDALLSAHPEVWAYRQANEGSCSTDPISAMVQAGYPTGFKDGPCEITVQQVIDLGVGLATYPTVPLLADDAALVNQLESNGVQAVSVLTTKPRRQLALHQAGATVIAPRPIAAEERILAAEPPPTQ